jgi:SRSO17 transposase
LWYNRANEYGEKNLFDPHRWGVPLEKIKSLGPKLQEHWQRFQQRFKSKTRDTSEHALAYMQGQMTMESDRNFAGIANSMENADGQAMQHFMSNSPWSGQGVYEQIQAEIKEKPELQPGSALILDEYADEKAGGGSAGALRQYNGRMGKVDMCQVAVALGYANWKLEPWPLWTMVDAEIFLPEVWFGDEYALLRQKVGVPKERTSFETKPELGLKMIRRAKAAGLPFEAVLCDSLYGRSSEFRQELREEKLLYMAAIPNNLRVYLEQPVVGVPEPKSGKKGPKTEKLQVLNEVRSYSVKQVGQLADTHWQLLRIRTNERGILEDRFAARRVWVWDDKQPEIVPHQEWLAMRIESNGDHTYAFSNAPEEATLQFLAELLCGRYFVERVIQDGKDEVGADEFQAQKYIAWEHHTALTACALWFIATTKLDWAKDCQRDPELAQQLELEALPALSTANVREMLRAVMPLPQLSPEEAQAQVIKHLVNRSRSTASRLRKRNKAEVQT